MATRTVRLHGVLRAPQERVCRAFLGADAMAKWLPHERLRCTDCFDDAMSVVQEGILQIIPVEACYLGRQDSLALLAKRVEAEIPGGQ